MSAVAVVSDEDTSSCIPNEDSLITKLEKIKKKLIRVKRELSLSPMGSPPGSPEHTKHPDVIGEATTKKRRLMAIPQEESEASEEEEAAASEASEASEEEEEEEEKEEN